MPKATASSPPQKTTEPTRSTPWSRLDRNAANLAVEDFPVMLIVQLGNTLRRTVTTRYADAFDLSESEWRILTLVTNLSPLSMVDLVIQSTSDKALVSRTVKTLREKGLIKVIPDPSGNLKRLVCTHTAKGRALHTRIFPIAQQNQARILQPLNREERDNLYHILRKLQHEHSDRRTPPGGE